MELASQREAVRKRRFLAGERKWAWSCLVFLLLVSCGQEAPTTQEIVEREIEPLAETAAPIPSRTLTTTPTQTATARALPTASATPSPSPLPLPASPTVTPTSRPTATPTPPPPFTPAAPQSATDYQLEPWTPERATILIARLEAYPDTLPEEARGSNDSNYYQAFAPAALAQEEALLRFPEAPEAESWRWGLAYNYVRSGDVRAAALYADLLEVALGSGEGSVEGLPAWFAEHERRLVLSPAGEAAGHLLFRVALTGPQSEATSGCYLLLSEERGAPRFYPLVHRDAFDPANGAGLTAGPADVTGDGREELITVQAHRPGGSSSYYYSNLVVYDLSSLPPRPLPFSPTLETHLGWGSDDGWQVVEEEESLRLRLRERPAENCETISVVTDYVWTGERMQQAKSGYDIGNSRRRSRYCLPFIFAAAEAGHEQALQYLEESIFSGGPAQADEWRYRLGLYQALAGNEEAATGYLGDLIADPRSTDRTWVRAAAGFLDLYEMPAGLYPACDAADECNPIQALRRLVKPLPAAAYALAPLQLRGWGVPVTRWGFFDMEGDGTLEQWLLISSGAQFQFWVVVPAGPHLEALFINTIGGNAYTARLERLSAAGGTPVIRVDNGRERFLFAFTANPTGGDAPLATVLRSQSANESDNYTVPLLAESQTSLWRGASPALIATNLVRFRQSAEFNCTLATLRPLCAEYRYTLGLAKELAGDPEAATAAYLELWQQFPDTPYATMARARLLPTTPATATPAP